MKNLKLIHLSLLTIKENPGNTPIMICDSKNKIRYKNKPAYLYELPKLGSKATNFLSRTDRKKLAKLPGAPKGCVFAILQTIKGPKPAVVVYNENESSTIWVFPKGLDMITDVEAIENMYSSVRKIALNITPAFISKADARFCLKHEQLKNKSFSKNDYTESGEDQKLITADSLFYILNRYMRQLLKSMDIPLSKISFDSDLPNKEAFSVANPYSFVSAFMTMLTMFAINNRGKISVKAVCDGNDLIFTAKIKTLVKVSESTDKLRTLAEQLPHSAIDTVYFDEVVESYGWSFDISPSGRNEITVKMGTSVVKTPLLSSDMPEHNCLISYTEFLEYLKN